MILMSPSISRRDNPLEHEVLTQTLPNRTDHVVGSSSSDPEAPTTLNRPKGRSPYGTHNPSAMHSATRRPSQAVHAYSGNEAGSFSDFSDTGFLPDSSLSLPKPSVSSSHPEQLPSQTTASTAAGSTAATPDAICGPSSPPRPTPIRQVSQVSTAAPPPDAERVVYHGWLYLLRTHRGLRQWKSLWCVLRPKGLALYKDEDEYKALLIIPFPNIIDAVDIDPISKSKSACFMVITEERNWRFCAMDEEGCMRWLGALKSLVAKRKEQEIREREEKARGRAASHAASDGKRETSKNMDIERESSAKGEGQPATSLPLR